MPLSPLRVNSQDSGTVPLTSTPRTLNSQEPSLVQFMAQLLQATLQSLPPISKFSGEDAEKEEKSFKHWLGLFEE